MQIILVRGLMFGAIVQMVGIVTYLILLFGLENTARPHYVPILMAIGAAVATVGVARNPSMGRCIASGIMILFAIGTIYFVYIGSRIERYDGPAVVGRPAPPFSAATADSGIFTDTDLAGPQETVVVFYRGIW